MVCFIVIFVIYIGSCFGFCNCCFFYIVIVLINGDINYVVIVVGVIVVVVIMFCCYWRCFDFWINIKEDGVFVILCSGRGRGSILDLFNIWFY